ncbi:MAG TPA: DUF2807 domain-containing protein [Caulobacteraceae bacterium]|jgi:hypothetical protein|nr:DUF2807 domain-containing protein [Caulobacteraceae bacterium]
MRASTGAALAALAALFGAGDANAASVDIKNAVARVTVIPEARSDISVTIVRDDPRRPLKVNVWPDGRTDIEGGYFGGLFGGIIACNSHGGRPYVRVFGAAISYDEMAEIVVRTPRDVRVSASGAVFGEVGRSENLDLHVDGCGDWVVANVHGRLSLANAGSGDIRTGSAGSMRISTAGSGDIYSHGVSSGFDASIAGSSDIHVAEASGPVKVRLNGSGDLGIGGGHASDLEVLIAGSGDLTYKGVADSLTAFVAGSGDVNVARVTGAVKKSIAGSGDVNVGH